MLARRCDTPQALIEHLRFKPWEKHIIQRLIAPHNQALRRFPQFRIGSDHMLAEQVLRGRQINVDGYVHQGRVHLLGVTDELMYPGTMAFLRFAFPAAHDEALREGLQAAADQLPRGFGLMHGFFNLAFFVDTNSGELTLIEINPRLPTRGDLDWLAAEYPQARLEVYPKKGASLQRDLKWLGSHRWAVLNMPGLDEADLQRRYERICARLHSPAPH